ncbi:hypothetical protein LTR70_007918 [Exophiala xenobiotica]|uniref:Uncharacterized protein n=1 Tax=Lithohypha guttulata TaxID=1690604 RepID=A0ABR0K9H7_9EURO|nr:hypothetical protein LTR24_005594 [Lithohypha guttulata]KAK5312923.1 hypothetical protein LTR70_007918 [Exophiala xenobiotica]
MAPQRRALQSITGNRRKTGELTARERGRIEAKDADGIRPAQIARNEDRPDLTTKRQWKKVIFMDQASVERGSGAKRMFTWRYGWEKLRRDLIRPKKKGKDLTVMIQAAIQKKGHGPIVVMKRDPEAKKKGYSARSYI